MPDEPHSEQSENAVQPKETPSPPDDGQPSGDLDPLVASSDEMGDLLRQRDEHYERLLRVTADFENFRKRIDRERREQFERAASDLLTDILPVLDDLERALAAEIQEGEVYRRGVEIIHKQLIDLMAKRGVSPIEALGTDFDPNVHQAVTLETSPTHRDGEVIEELRRGYMLRDRLLRAAMVKVAKA
jgi:molecular chaperone GrpE